MVFSPSHYYVNFSVDKCCDCIIWKSVFDILLCTGIFIYTWELYLFVNFWMYICICLMRTITCHKGKSAYNPLLLYAVQHFEHLMLFINTHGFSPQPLLCRPFHHKKVTCMHAHQGFNIVHST